MLKIEKKNNVWFLNYQNYNLEFSNFDDLRFWLEAENLI